VKEIDFLSLSNVSNIKAKLPLGAQNE